MSAIFRLSMFCWNQFQKLRYRRKAAVRPKNSSKSHRKRQKFSIDIPSKGQLFLDDTKNKNFVTCFKDKEFLDFFYSRIRPVREKEERHDGYRWISPCGVESNFIKVDLVPVGKKEFSQIVLELFYCKSTCTILQLGTFCMNPVCSRNTSSLFKVVFRAN